jgi:hypothetical protein
MASVMAGAVLTEADCPGASHAIEILGRKQIKVGNRGQRFPDRGFFLANTLICDHG